MVSSYDRNRKIRNKTIVFLVGTILKTCLTLETDFFVRLSGLLRLLYDFHAIFFTSNGTLSAENKFFMAEFRIHT